jgi:hypothetical protein
MWIRIRAVIIEDEPLGYQYLAKLLDETCQVEVVGSATESPAGFIGAVFGAGKIGAVSKGVGSVHERI